MKKIVLPVAALVVFYADFAEATPIVYHGNNPQISPSAYPSNEGAINDIANLTRPKNTHTQSSLQTATDSQILKNSAINAIAQRNNDTLFGTANSGRIDLSGGAYALFTTDTVAGIRTVTFYKADNSVDTVISFSI